MTIEVSDRKYWQKLKFHDGLLYISLLEIDDKNDWRMLKAGDAWWNTELDTMIQELKWYSDYDWFYSEMTMEDDVMWAIPVRDNL